MRELCNEEPFVGMGPSGMGIRTTLTSCSPSIDRDGGGL
jgi:hypothetical protein